MPAGQTNEESIGHQKKIRCSRTSSKAHTNIYLVHILQQHEYLSWLSTRTPRRKASFCESRKVAAVMLDEANTSKHPKPNNHVRTYVGKHNSCNKLKHKSLAMYPHSRRVLRDDDKNRSALTGLGIHVRNRHLSKDMVVTHAPVNDLSQIIFCTHQSTMM